MQSVGTQFSAVFLVEHDKYGELLWSWSYPAVDPGNERVIVDRLSSMQQDVAPFIFCRLKSDWCYILTETANKDVSPALELFSVGLLVKGFNPEKFQSLLRLLAAQYRSTGDPTKILEGYLSVFTSGQFGTWRVGDWQDAKAYISNSSLREVVNMLGVESVLVWNAVVLKKRVCVLADTLPRLLVYMRCLPQFAWHRQDWSALHPFVAYEEIDQLASLGVYIAGFVDPRVASRIEAYDVLVNFNERNVVVAEHAAEELRMGPLHREVAQLLVDSAQAASEQDVLKRIARKTKDIADSVRAAAEGDGGLQSLTARGMGATMLRFYQRFAMAEGLA